MVFAEIDADRARETQVAVGERVVGVVCDVREPGTRRRARRPRRATTSVASTCSSTTSGHFGGRARRVPRADRRRVGRPLPRQPRARLRVLACGAAGAARAGRRRQHRQRLDDRGVPRHPDACGLLRVQGGDHRASPGRSRSSTRAHGVRVNAIAPDVTETLQVPYSKWVGPDERAPDPHVGAARPLRSAGRHRGRRAVPRVRALGVRHRDDRARRRRYVRGGRMVSDGGGWMDQPAASTLTADRRSGSRLGAGAPRASRGAGGCGARTSPTCAPTPMRKPTTTRATDRKMVIVFVTAAVALDVQQLPLRRQPTRQWLESILRTRRSGRARDPAARRACSCRRTATSTSSRSGPSS